MSLYRIVPKDKKSVEYVIEMYNEDGQGVTVTETYRFGQGFVDVDEFDPDDINEDRPIRCNPRVGPGCELDGLISVMFEFSDDIDEDERALFVAQWGDDC